MSGFAPMISPDSYNISIRSRSAIARRGESAVWLLAIVCKTVLNVTPSGMMSGNPAAELAIILLSSDSLLSTALGWPHFPLERDEAREGEAGRGEKEMRLRVGLCSQKSFIE
jgi:hypothetical protein